MSIVDVVKPLLLVFSASAFVAVIYPPRPAVNGKRPVYRGQSFELLVRHLAHLGCVRSPHFRAKYATDNIVQTLVTAAAFSHAMLLIVQNPRSGVLMQWLCPSSRMSLETLAGLPARFLAGVALVTLGTILRATSYRALGTLFTFEVVIKDDHSLVTRGPYRYVRHPAYTGAALVMLGSHLIHFGSAGYVTQCEIENSPFLVFVYVWRVGTIFSVLSLGRRCGVEDNQLREQFGNVWEQYRIDVPYRLLPYIY